MTHSLDADELLKIVNKTYAQQRRGKFKIFLGMCAGVGKTYAMLQAAQQLQAQGINVLVGYVETHGRQETDALLENLKVLPRLQVTYRGTLISEFDLEGALQANPQVILIDELAHSNAPGQRHRKRYQDVLEILDAGIDVLTTLNIQHLESRADAIQQITGNPIYERVPDSVIDEATELLLIDISPEDLLERLRVGKVYQAENATRASEHFFQKSYLTALREMALRLTAEQVDQDLKHFLGQTRKPGIWHVDHQLMVAVGPGPGSAALVRLTRRMAYQMNCKWLAVHVEVKSDLPEAAIKSLRDNIALASDLGAEVVYVKGESLYPSLLQAAENYQATQLIIGKPRQSFWQDLFSGNLKSLYNLLYQSEALDIWMVDSYKTSSFKPNTANEAKAPPGRSKLKLNFSGFKLMLLTIGMITALSHLLIPWLGYNSIGLFFLVGMVILSLFVERTAILVGAILSALAWNFFFIPPIYTLYIVDVHNLLMCALYIGVSLFTGQLVYRIRQEENLGKQREKRLSLLYQFNKNTLATDVLPDLIVRSEKILSAQMGSPVKIETQINIFENADTQADVVRNWVYRNQEPAGKLTHTLTLTESLYLPIKTQQAIYGVLSFAPLENISPDNMNLLTTLTSQLASRLEALSLQQQAKQAEFHHMSSSLYEALLNSVSHELRTPITTIRGAVHNLRDPQISAVLSESLLEDLESASHRLNHVVANLLDASRLQSGKLSLNENWHDPGDIVRAGIAPLKQELLKDYDFELNIPLDLVPVWGDFGLLEQVVHNLVHNAIFYSPPGSQIRISLRQHQFSWQITVRDNGDGIAPQDLPSIFDKFYRGYHARAGGTGLGLSICQGIVQAHGGDIKAYNDAGAVFEVSLPLKKMPAIPEESDE